MTTAPAPNPRASLLAGLRTGGVRATSSPLANIPHTAAPGGSFNVPRFASNNHNMHFQEEEADEVGDMPSYNHNMYNGSGNRQMPMTAAVDGPNNRFSQQQQTAGQRGLNVNSLPFSPGFGGNLPSTEVQAQAMQMQLMQLEIMRLQAIQAQQYQAEIIAQAQRQAQPQRRASTGFNPPASAGPLTNSFGNSAQSRRPSQVEQLKAQLGVGGDDQVPMTAALGGKFGSRSLNGSSRFGADGDDSGSQAPPPTPSHTTVISGGTSLGNPSSNNISNGIGNGSGSGSNTPSKSESVSSWRRGGNNNSVLSGNRAVTISPSVKITPPPGERVSPPPLSASGNKSRPQPLRFNVVASQPIEVVAIDTDAPDVDAEDGYSTSSSKSATSPRSNPNSISSPTTPRSASSSDIPLSPREEASKKLYEGLGIGRPAPTSGPSTNAQVSVHPAVVSHRMASQPMRQPRGPPSGADELGPKNFATRIRRKAIGGLGVLMGARERREFVEAY